MRVLLPAPFSPRMTCTSPFSSSKSTPSSAVTPGKRLVMPRISRRGLTSPLLPHRPNPPPVRYCYSPFMPYCKRRAYYAGIFLSIRAVPATMGDAVEGKGLGDEGDPG